MMVAVIGAIVFMEAGHRKIPIQYAKRVVGRRMYGGQSTYLPLKINTSGVIPPIFASSIMVFPATIAQFVGGQNPGGWSRNHRATTLAWYTALFCTNYSDDYLFCLFLHRDHF